MSLFLQTCGECGAVQYPSRAVCRTCLSADLAVSAIEVTGAVMAETSLHRSLEPTMLADGPMRIGAVATELGIRLIVKLAPDVSVGAPVDLIQPEQGAPILAVPIAGPKHNVKVSS